jgi:RND family efflux transporter MFP subunit
MPDNIVPGALVSLPTSAIFQVVAPETIYFEAEVSEVDIYKLKTDAQAEVEIDAYPDEVFNGKVQSYNFSSTTTSTGGTAYKIRVSLPKNEGLKFKIGMNGDVSVIISEKDDVLLVPITSVVEEDDKKYVWLSDDGKAKKVEVKTAASSVDEMEITSGISETEEVVIRPPSKIEEGVKLKISN